MVRTIRFGLTAAIVVGALCAPAAAVADTYVPISGSGSTWSQVAVDAWRADVRASGVVVNFTGNGSTAGRSDYIAGTVDFANTEIPFQHPPEPGQQDEVPDRKYAYLPIVAGGTAFMYNLTVGGQRVRDLRLSAPTLAKIFTGQITKWNDPAIAKDYGRALPNVRIIPVLRADGAGASAQFTKYMASQAPTVYCPFIQKALHLGGSGCPSVSFYPAFGASKAQSGSNGVANYVSASYGQGAIGYVEYAYAKRINFPVVSLLNAGGYYTQPTAGNVAVALTKAQINADLTQNLASVYTNPDPRTYPMSSYSYMVAPTTTQAPFNNDKGKTLSTFINYFLCQGQQKADKLGYSPLPKNLVEAGFDQVRRIPGAVQPPSISACNNPALSILQTAPMPNKCAKAGAVCDSASPTTSGGGNEASTGGGTPVTGDPAASAAPDVTAPVTGSDPVAAASANTGTSSVSAVSVTLQREDDARQRVLYLLSALLLVVVVLVPPIVVATARPRSRRAGR